MKYIIAFALMALLGCGEARHHHHGIKKSLKNKSPKSMEHSLIQMNFEANQELFKVVNDKLAQVSKLVEISKMEPVCDSACEKNCDKKADEMIRELSNPLRDITWNCKNNYNVYTTDYDPEHEHLDRVSMDVMDV